MFCYFWVCIHVTDLSTVLKFKSDFCFSFSFSLQFTPTRLVVNTAEGQAAVPNVKISSRTTLRWHSRMITHLCTQCTALQEREFTSQQNVLLLLPRLVLVIHPYLSPHLPLLSKRQEVQQPSHLKPPLQPHPNIGHWQLKSIQILIWNQNSELKNRSLTSKGLCMVGIY